MNTEAMAAARYFSTWAKAANQILFAVAYCDERRGFKSIAEWEPTPAEGWGTYGRRPRLVDGSRLDRCLDAKADYVRMAEEAESRGDSWDTVEFNRMCREGFEKILGTKNGEPA